MSEDKPKLKERDMEYFDSGCLFTSFDQNRHFNNFVLHLIILFFSLLLWCVSPLHGPYSGKQFVMLHRYAINSHIFLNILKYEPHYKQQKKNGPKLSHDRNHFSSQSATVRHISNHKYLFRSSVASISRYQCSHSSQKPKEYRKTKKKTKHVD